MYQKLIFLVMLFISIILISSLQIYAKGDGKFIIICERVNDVKDSNTYKSFTTFNFFQPIVFDKLHCPQSSNQTNLFRVTDLQNNGKKKEKPPLKGGKIACEIGAGAGCGILAGALGFLIGAAVTPAGEGQFGELNKVGGGGIGFIIGYPLGNSIGIYLVGNRDSETGSFGTTLLGSMLGMVAATALSPVMFQDDFPRWIALPVFFSLPITGGIIGFSMTRSYRSPLDSGTAFLNIRNGHMRIASPAIYFRLNPLHNSELIPNICLVKVRF
jgi:hypothetical protein